MHSGPPKFEERRSIYRSLDARFFSVTITLLLLIVLAAGVFWMDRVAESWVDRAIGRETSLIATSFGERLTQSAEDRNAQVRLVVESHKRAGVVAAVLCGPDRRELARSGSAAVHCRAESASRALARPGVPVPTGEDLLVLTARRVDRGGAYALVVHDRAAFSRRRHLFIQRAAIGGTIAILAIGLFSYFGGRLIRSNVRRRITDVLRVAFAGGTTENVPPELTPVIEDLQQRVAALRASRQPGSASGAESLRRLVVDRMADTNLILIANREPYLHQFDGDRIRIDRPASGLVTGVEPLLRACGGVWIAHGSGSADRQTADARGRLAVPPENPEYVLRRIWLTRREEEGYYYGFANEGLWPLCHIAHTRPLFRPEDWNEYRKVNERFAAAAAEEAGEGGALILVQDYHFALVPQELRALSPRSVISLFWHIPWPNHEVVGICPWRVEILTGMLGADVIGFHTRYHCLNFLETVQRYLAARVDLETMTVEYQGRRTHVKPYPISVEWPYPAASLESGKALRRELGIGEDVHVMVSADRADYTKGLIEKINAIDYLLAAHPELADRFVFIQLAAPSRTNIKIYRDLNSELEESVARLNRKFRQKPRPPVILQLRGHSPEEVRRYYAMADSALVTPLHDGMNLVAKEYVASRTDERGVLILSTFAGASKELDGALVVNPYDVGDVAEAIYRAVMMPEDERIARMRSMRGAVERNTIYDWSAALLTDMARVWDKRRDEWRTNDLVTRS